MQFLMLVCKDTEPVTVEGEVPDIEDWVTSMDARGVRLLGDPVEPDRNARTVRVRGGRAVVTDGPFIETKEVLAGFDVLECADMDEAVAVAAAHPMAWTGVIDLRPMLSD